MLHFLLDGEQAPTPETASGSRSSDGKLCYVAISGPLKATVQVAKHDIFVFLLLLFIDTMPYLFLGKWYR